MIQILYRIIVFYVAIHLVWYIIREKKFWNQLAGAMVLIIFFLRLFLVK